MIIYNFCVPLSKVVQHTECIILNHYFIISYSLVTYFVSPSRKVWWCTTLLEKKRVTGCPNSTPSRVCTQKLSPQQWVQFQPGPFTTCHHLFPHRKNIFFKRVKKKPRRRDFVNDITVSRCILCMCVLSSFGCLFLFLNSFFTNCTFVQQMHDVVYWSFS